MEHHFPKLVLTNVDLQALKIIYKSKHICFKHIQQLISKFNGKINPTTSKKFIRWKYNN